MKTTREIIKENKLQLIRYVIAILLWVGLTMFISYQINTAEAYVTKIITHEDELPIDYFPLLLMPQDHTVPSAENEHYSEYMRESMERVAKQMQRDAECNYFGIPRGVKCTIRWNNIGSNAFGYY